MNNKDLVKALREESLYANKATLEIMDYCMNAADAIERLEAENAALRAKPEQPEKPLKLDELREMRGEPIWTVTMGVEDSGRWELCACEMVRACPLHLVLRCATAIGEATDYEFDTYGKTWLAYRRKPEQEGA